MEFLEKEFVELGEVCQENCEVTEYAEYCKEFVWRISRYLIGSCWKEFVRRICAQENYLMSWEQ